MPEPRYRFASATDGSAIYVVGGLTTSEGGAGGVCLLVRACLLLRWGSRPLRRVWRPSRRRHAAPALWARPSAPQTSGLPSAPQTPADDPDNHSPSPRTLRFDFAANEWTPLPGERPCCHWLASALPARPAPCVDGAHRGVGAAPPHAKHCQTARLGGCLLGGPLGC
jgi:hypothetical protein